jgi:hyperosmotically inducible protein
MNKKMVRGAVVVFSAAILMGGVGLGSYSARAMTAVSAQQQPDNTGANKQNGTTADQQKNNPEDRELAQKIRRAITSDKTISTDGHNVKVIVRDGMVTLKGPVRSEEEKKNIESKAADLAGADKVTNKLTVKPS